VASTQNSLTYTYLYPGANYCSIGSGSLEVEVYADAGFTQLVKTWSAPKGASQGASLVSGLAPGTMYYAKGRTSGWLSTPVTIAPFSTKPLSTTTTTRPTIACDPAPPQATLQSATTTSLTFAFSSPGAVACDGNGITRVLVFADAAHSRLAGQAASAAGATSGTLTVTGLDPDTTYYPTVRLSTSPFGAVEMSSARTLGLITTGVTTTCQPIGIGGPSATTATSITWSLPSNLCASMLTVTAYRSQADAQAQTDPVTSSTVVLPSASIALTGLQPGTDYWARFSSGFGLQGPIHTANGTTSTTPPLTTTTGSKTCSATWQTVSSWPGGFVGQVTVTNRSDSTSSSWQVGWTWTGSARLTASYHATLGGTAVSPTLTALDWNRVVGAGRSVTVQVQGTATGPVPVPAINCSMT
jgi:hypothetical protein